VSKGRPNNHTPYRQNLHRVSATEDILIEIINEIPVRSVKAREIVKNKLAELRLKEIQKVHSRNKKSL
jgi:hypothetical protein